MKEGIESGMMKEKITSHLDSLIKNGSRAIELQFTSSLTINRESFSEDDPLGEESLYSPVKGIVHKFKNRVLWKVSYRCAAHCQFCTRIRQIGSSKGDLSEVEIQNCFKYIKFHTEIEEVILSGGDPFFTVKNTLTILKGLAEIKSIKVIRIGTRLPVHSPSSFETIAMKSLLKEIKRVAKDKPIIIILHVNHKDEIDSEVRKVIGILKKTGATLMSQTVFLRGINDDVSVLSDLFRTLYHLGILPYYIYRCDYVKGLEHFVCSIEKEQYIMTELRRQLSGIAIPLYVIDVSGKGKIPVPLAFWDGISLIECKDFDSKKISII